MSYMASVNQTVCYMLTAPVRCSSNEEHSPANAVGKVPGSYMKLG